MMMEKIVLYSLVALAIGFSGCTDDQEPPNLKTVEDMFIGTWLEYAPCDSCTQLVFLKNRNLEQTYLLEDQTLLVSYSVISKDSIQVVRDWEFLPELDGKPTNHRFILHTPDTLEIFQFVPAYYGTGFQDIRMIKISDL